MGWTRGPFVCHVLGCIVYADSFHRDTPSSRLNSMMATQLNSLRRGTLQQNDDDSLLLAAGTAGNSASDYHLACLHCCRVMPPTGAVTDLSSQQCTQLCCYIKHAASAVISSWLQIGMLSNPSLLAIVRPKTFHPELLPLATRRGPSVG